MLLGAGEIAELRVVAEGADAMGLGGLK